MKLAALTSGGKDSILAVWKAKEAGHEICAMISVIPENPESYMFHAANLAAVPVMAKRAGMTYIPVHTAGEKEEEVEDLKRALADAKALYGIEGVTSGAVASEYQRSRVSRICEETGLVHIAPLWGMAPDAVIADAAALLDARIVVTAADGLGENVLGKRIDEGLIRVLKAVEKKRRINVAGEGGEYESLVLDAPFFSEPVHAEGAEVRFEGMRGVVTYERFW